MLLMWRKVSFAHNTMLDYFKSSVFHYFYRSHAHSTSRKVENIRCSYCHGAIEIFLNKKDKEGNIIPTPLREPTGFAKFVKDNYKTYKQIDRKHSEIMKILSTEFVALKINQKN